MRKNILVVSTAIILVLALAIAAMAADPIIGTWKLNVAKSKLTPDPAGRAKLKEWTETVRELGDQFEATGTIIRTDGFHGSYKFTYPQQGGVLTFQQRGDLPEALSVVRTLIETGNEYWTLLLNSKQVEVDHWVVSKGGKTWTNTVKGTDLKGKPFEGLQLWEKQ